MQLSKPEAEQEVIRRWYALPPNLRQTYEDAEIYASHLDRELDFYTVTSRQRLIEAWLIREIHRSKAAPAAEPDRVGEGEAQNDALIVALDELHDKAEAA